MGGLQGLPFPQQQQPDQQAPSPTPQPTPQQPQEDTFAQQKQFYQQQIQQNTPVDKNGVKGLLSNFFQGMGSSMMRQAGLPTPYDKVQQAQQGLDRIQQMQSTLGLQHQQLQNQAMLYQQMQRSPAPAGFEDKGIMPGAMLTPKEFSDQLLKSANMKQQAENAAQLQGVKNTGAANVADIRANATLQRPSGASRDDRFIKLSGVSPSTWTPDDQQFMKGYQKYVDVTKTQPGVARMQMLVAPRWAALDPERQGQIAAAKSLAAGVYGNQTTSFNAFIGHAGDLNDAFKELGNTDIKLLNTGINKLKEQTDPKIVNVMAKLEPVRKEFESFLLNNRALYDADRKSADTILSENSTPAQMQTALRSMAHTAGIRLGALNSSVKRVTGADVPDLLEPSNGSILEELGGSVPDYQGGGSFNKSFGSPQFGGKAGSNATKPVKPTANAPAVRFTEGSDQYDIPADKVAAFKAKHPQAVPSGR